jgi:hypothetical protein
MEFINEAVGSDVPAESFEERVEELAAKLRFVVVGRTVGLTVAVEPLD